MPLSKQVEFFQAATEQGRFYTYDRNADPENSRTLPIVHKAAGCMQEATGPLVKPTRVQFVAGKIVPAPALEPCKISSENALALLEAPLRDLHAEVRQGDDDSAADGRFLAQPAHMGVGARMPGAARPDPVRQGQDDERLKVNDHCFEIGRKFGSAISGIESGLETLSTRCSRFEEDLRENPELLADIQTKIAKTLNEIPLPPTYETPELKALAAGAFSRGFEEGFGAKKLQFFALNAAATLSVLIIPNVYLAAETAAAKAIRLAVERVRAVPIYVPAMTNGAGFFLRVPKAPAAKLEPYKQGGGHHVPAKRAFEGASGYDPQKALAIPKAELSKLGIDHAEKLTPEQMKAYKAFAKTGQPLTWEAIATIETEALVKAGMPLDMAKATLAKAIQALKDAGVAAPVRIPWGK